MLFKKGRIAILIIIILIFDIVFSPALILLTSTNKYVSEEQIQSSSIYTYNSLFSSKHNEFDSKDIITLYSSGLTNNIKAADVFENAKFEKVNALKYSIIMVLYKAKDQAGNLSLTEPLRNYSGDLSKKINLLANERGYVISGKLIYFRNELYLIAHIKKEDNHNYELDDTNDMILSVSDTVNNNVCLFKVEGENKKALAELNKDNASNKKTYPEIFFDLRYDTLTKVVAISLFVAQFAIVFIIYYYIIKHKKHTTTDESRKRNKKSQRRKK